ncbi:MAG: C1 family peptidase [Acidiferrobacteraceae bacterium]
MTYCTGHIPDHPAVVARRLGLHHFRGIGAMRTAPLGPTSNRAKLWGIWDQHDASGCEGCAHASGVTLRLALAGTPLSEPVSNVGLYLGALLVDRQPNPDGTLPALIDQGTMPSSILTAMGLWGSCGASAWGQQPMSGATMWSDPTTQALIEPTPEKLYAESSFKLGGAYFIQSTGNQKILDIMAALAAGFPVSIAIPASGQDFQGYKGGVLGALSGPVDHANLLVDVLSWDGKDPTTAVFVGVNSWNQAWGEGEPGNPSNITGGMYRCNSDFIAGLQDACILDVTRSST